MAAQRETVSRPAVTAHQISALPESPSAARREAGRSAEVLWHVEALNALCDLDRVDRIALQLIYWRDLTQAQVARELALPEATISQCVARGMQELARLLSGGARQLPAG